MTTPFRSIYVPLDGSPFAEQALALAVAIGKAAKAKLRLVLVHQQPSMPTTPDAAALYTKIEVATRKAERDYLNRLVNELKQEGYRGVTSVVLTGTPGPTLAEHAVEWGASLVVMSTHGRGPLERAWLGSVADYLVRHLAVPMLLVRPNEEEEEPPTAADLTRQVLVPLDGSSLGETALEPAAGVARLFDAELHLVQVVRPVAMPVSVPISFPVGYDAQLSELCRQDGQSYLDRVAERVRPIGVQVSTEAVLGEGVASTLLDLVERESVGIVALATHGRGGLRRLALGSVADKLVRAAGRPVLVCPIKGRRG